MKPDLLETRQDEQAPSVGYEAQLTKLVRSVTGSEPLNKRPLLIADDLEEEFLREGWPTGRNFGGEAALAERYGVGRDVLREVVRLLEGRDHAKMRRGPHGGLEVVRPRLEDLLGRLAGYAYVTSLQRVRVLEMWTILGSVAIQLMLGADARNSANLGARLAQWCEPSNLSMRDLGRALIASTQSTVLTILGTCVESLLPQHAADLLDKPAMQRLREIAASRDAESLLVDWLRNDLLPSAIARLEVRPGAYEFSPPQLPQGDYFKNQAMQVVHELMSATQPSRWSRGHLIGNEFDLTGEYRVDKSIIRQAIRLMEDAETATALPGRGRGLVTRLPSTAPLSRLISAFFLAHAVDELDGERVFRALSIECVGWAAEHASAEDRMALLGLCTDLRQLSAPVPIAALQSFERFQQHAAHNPLLNVCIDAIKAFLSWRIGSCLIASPSIIKEYKIHTERVITAICAHDRRAAMFAEQVKLEALYLHRRQNDPVHLDEKAK
ncbi:GntR family transcriptional regulator [Burkholderia gladioli]|uniref:GntR family transcriptional regulator n=1 Tax=Burkholderia gladioli TaxID=28095 RepID=UPI000CFED6FD|nr:GntR family transcriptional regulator [Burkholderia gladioli]MBU9172091.1 GntR family transcriptional regulator [Burkholderia gladioli]MBU9179354.1 GntR family transcriptional regulator [Burkholderia gladioli]MBU9384345.1 GntR family transcriptional regulator [Burkholderia gladioli]MDN7807118.1 GntR family transcriptional regulator [Burkholderia gladioli]PRG88585.1 GntR family transcriptional regulator [Burkholderia gladioli]